MLKIFALGLGCLICSIAAAEPVIYRVAVKENLEFLEKGRPERMDLYCPADPRPGDKFPGVVIIHGGGGYQGARNNEGELDFGVHLARMGYVCISIDYRLATPENLKKYGKIFPVSLQDCKTAVQWLRKNAEQLHLDPAKIGTIGGSAGGHLAALTALTGPEAGLEPEVPYKGTDTSVQACVNFYGCMDYPGYRAARPTGRVMRHRIVGSKPLENRKDWLRMSPIDQVGPSDPPMLLVYGTADTVVPSGQGVMMKQVLDKAGVYNELILLEGFGHGFSLQRAVKDAVPPFVRQRVFAFFDRFLKDLSAEKAAERFAALEKFEKKHPASTLYGVLSLDSGKVIKSDKTGIKLVSSGKKYFFEPAFDLRFEFAEPAELREDVSVIVQGKKRRDNSISCRMIFGITGDRKEIPGFRGILRKRGKTWFLETGRRTPPVKLVISPETKFYICVPARPDAVKPGAEVIGLKARNYGDSRKVYSGLFTK